MSALRPLLGTIADAETRELSLTATDGVTIGLTRFRRGPSERSVLLIHGLTASSDCYVMDEHDNLVEALLDAGWTDVWSLDWRGSCRLPYNTTRRNFNIDDVALCDIPAAVAAIRRHNGGRPIAVIAHCVGAIALSMSIAAKLTGPLAAVVANSVFLTPNLPEASRLKITAMPSLLERICDDGYIPVELAKVGLLSRHMPMFALAARASSCKDPTCQMVNYVWGTGDTCLFEHRNLHPTTHGRLGQLLGPPPLSFYVHLAKMANERAVIRHDLADARYDRLPRSALDVLQGWKPPLLLVNGVHNRVWTGSMELCHGYLRERHPEVDATLMEVPGYGHLDVFIGRAAALDVFPRIIAWLDDRVPARG